MNVPFADGVLDFLKLKMFPEIKAIQAEIATLHGDDKLIQDQLKQQDRVMTLILDEMREIKAEVRELRSYVFTSQMHNAAYVVRDKPNP